MKKDNKNLIIIILSVIVILLLFIVVFMYLKIEYFDDKEELQIPNNPVTSSVNTTINEAKNNYISSNEALEIALKSLNISQNNIHDLSNELDYKFGVTVYEIDFKYNKYEYEFYINAQTGEVLKSFRERD